MKNRSLAHRGELLLSLGLLAFGIFILVDSQTITEFKRYEQIGPRLFPALIGVGLAFFGAVLAWQALRGGWRNMPSDQEVHDTPGWRAFLVLSAAMILQMALLKWIGFVLASTLLFVLVARGFGSRRWQRDLVIGVLVSLSAFYLFTLALGLALPRSPLALIEWMPAGVKKWMP